jgi:hypothetical protein
MRISEKTFELNICAQINQNLKKRILWFGLTQTQEAEAGFDAAFRLGGKILMFQFKASNNTLSSGARRFQLEHEQLQNLINRVKGYRRCIYYIFPLIGDTHELNIHKGDYFNTSYALDVSTLPNPFPPPHTKGTKKVPSRPRANNKHYADLLPPIVTIHSDPVEASLIPLNEIVLNNFAGSDDLKSLIFANERDYKSALQFIEPFRKNFKMAVII